MPLDAERAESLRDSHVVRVDYQDRTLISFVLGTGDFAVLRCPWHPYDPAVSRAEFNTLTNTWAD